MSLVCYDSSTDSSEDDKEQIKLHHVEQTKTRVKRNNIESISSNLCKKPKLPVPDVVKSMYKDTSGAPLDDPTSHRGRIRSFAHEKGNWASFVYIPYDHPALLRELSEKFIECLKPCGEFHGVEDFHASLSQTFVIRHHWIESLLEEFKKNCKQQQRYCCQLNGIQFYSNDEETRTFLGITIDIGTDQLKSFVSGIDRALQEYKLPIYYKNPSFHVSVAWAAGDLASSVTEQTKQQLLQLLTEYSHLYPAEMLLQGTQLFLKTGNKSFSIPLS